MALPERESMDFDVVVVGAGPAGLAAAIRLKQRAAEIGEEISVVVVEKGSEVGAHILSGAVIDPIGLDRLLPDWRSDPERPLKTEVRRDEFMMLTKNSGVICLEMMKKIHDAGFRIVEVPVHHYHRAFGKSQFFNFRRIGKTGVDVLRLWFALVVLHRHRGAAPAISGAVPDVSDPTTRHR